MRVRVVETAFALVDVVIQGTPWDEVSEIEISPVWSQDRNSPPTIGEGDWVPRRVWEVE